MARKTLQIIREKWQNLRNSRGFHNVALYLVFVVIASLFWLVMWLNDSIQETFDVRLRIYNVPDSVTFIDNPPAGLHVTVRDKGTSLLGATARPGAADQLLGVCRGGSVPLLGLRPLFVAAVYLRRLGADNVALA